MFYKYLYSILTPPVLLPKIENPSMLTSIIVIECSTDFIVQWQDLHNLDNQVYHERFRELHMKIIWMVIYLSLWFRPSPIQQGPSALLSYRLELSLKYENWMHVKTDGSSVRRTTYLVPGVSLKYLMIMCIYWDLYSLRRHLTKVEYKSLLLCKIQFIYVLFLLLKYLQWLW